MSVQEMWKEKWFYVFHFIKVNDAAFLDTRRDTYRDDGNHLYVANVGNSRTVISKAGKGVAAAMEVLGWLLFQGKVFGVCSAAFEGSSRHCSAYEQCRRFRYI